MISQLDLLNMHVSALFTLDEQKRLNFVNEPWDNSKPAPLLYVGKTIESEHVLYVRKDVNGGMIKQAYELANMGIYEPGRYATILNAGHVVEEICYVIPKAYAKTHNCVMLTIDNIDEFDLYEFEWLRDEIRVALPCCVYLEDGKVVSVCRSVRISDAHEAGIETAGQYKGRGYAGHVLSAWSDAVKVLGKTPLYSTQTANIASQRVAAKSGLQVFATGFHISNSW